MLVYIFSCVEKWERFLWTFVLQVDLTLHLVMVSNLNCLICLFNIFIVKSQVQVKVRLPMKGLKDEKVLLAILCFQCFNSNIFAWPIPSSDISKTWCVILKVLQYHRVANNRMFAQAYWRATKKSGNNIHQAAFLHVATASCGKKKVFWCHLCQDDLIIYLI